MIKNAVLSFVIFLFLISCVGNTQKTESASKLLTPLEKYSSYTVDSVFNSEQFLEDVSGTWVCYKSEKDSIRIKYPMFNYDEAMAVEMERYYYLSIEDDNLVVNNSFSIPIFSYSWPIDSLGKRNNESFLIFAEGINQQYRYEEIYRIKAKNGVRYKELADSLINIGDTIPYYNFIKDPMTSLIWCYPDVMAMYFEGYNYYFKKGEPNNEGIIGIPSDRNNRFIVNRVYKSCTIEESAYKLIEDFPSGTENLLERDRETGESYFWDSSGEFNATVYDWKNEDEVIVSVGLNRNCTFVFEFNQVGDDVHIKYWNDVVFPYEEEYQGH